MDRSVSDLKVGHIRFDEASIVGGKIQKMGNIDLAHVGNIVYGQSPDHHGGNHGIPSFAQTPLT
jgi:hypothetical protein